jgi:hypothetical protein
VTAEEVALLLGHAETLERRARPSDPAVFAAQVAAWHVKLARIGFEDAWAALDEHYDEESRWLMPADITRRVADMHQQWHWAHSGTEIPPGCGRELAIPPHIARARRQAIESGNGRPR